MKVLRKLIMGRAAARLFRTLYEHQRSGESKQTSGEGLHSRRGQGAPEDAAMRVRLPPGSFALQELGKEKGKGVTTYDGLDTG